MCDSIDFKLDNEKIKLTVKQEVFKFLKNIKNKYETDTEIYCESVSEGFIDFLNFIYNDMHFDAEEDYIVTSKLITKIAFNLGKFSSEIYLHDIDGLDDVVDID